MSKINKIDSINLVKASAWQAYSQYIQELKRKPEDRKTDKSEYINRGKANNGQAIND